MLTISAEQHFKQQDLVFGISLQNNIRAKKYIFAVTL